MTAQCGDPFIHAGLLLQRYHLAVFLRSWRSLTSSLPLHTLVQGKLFTLDKVLQSTLALNQHSFLGSSNFAAPDAVEPTQGMGFELPSPSSGYPRSTSKPVGRAQSFVQLHLLWPADQQL